MPPLPFRVGAAGRAPGAPGRRDPPGVAAGPAPPLQQRRDPRVAVSAVPRLRGTGRRDMAESHRGARRVGLVAAGPGPLPPVPARLRPCPGTPLTGEDLPAGQCVCGRPLPDNPLSDWACGEPCQSAWLMHQANPDYPHPREIREAADRAVARTSARQPSQDLVVASRYVRTDMIPDGTA